MKEQDAEPIKHDMPPRPQSNRSKTLEGHKGFKRLKQKEVLQRFWNKHKDKYSYHQMVYKNKRTKVRIGHSSVKTNEKSVKDQIKTSLELCNPEMIVGLCRVDCDSSKDIFTQ